MQFELCGIIHVKY
jgi:hypothetical protein